MKCWVCKRQARGYGHTDGRFKTGDARRYVLDWVFCSRRCQDAFHMLYGNWTRAKEGCVGIGEVAMIDPSDVELAAMRKCLKAFGEAAGEIGFGKPRTGGNLVASWCATIASDQQVTMASITCSASASE